MPQIEKKDILGTILKSTIGIIGRRTSEPYANMIIQNILTRLIDKYDFLKYIDIKSEKFKEEINLVEIDDDIENVEIELIGSAIKDFMIALAERMGKDAGFYFIKEIKEDLPYEYEKRTKQIGVDLELIQSEFLYEIKDSLKFSLSNFDVLKNIFTLLHELLEDKVGRNFAYETLTELVGRLSTQYDPLTYVKINDVRSIQNMDIVSVDKEVNNTKPEKVGLTIQKIIQEIINETTGKLHDNNFSIIEHIKDKINADYSLKLKQMGVDLDVVKLKQTLLVKRVIESLIDILSESSTESYSVVIIKDIIKKYISKYEFLGYIYIDSVNFSKAENAIKISEEINSVSPSNLGRAIQKIIEKVSTSLGEEAGQFFLDKLQKKVGKAYILRLEEIGVNLHMIELRRTLL